MQNENGGLKLELQPDQRKALEQYGYLESVDAVCKKRPRFFVLTYGDVCYTEDIDGKRSMPLFLTRESAEQGLADRSHRPELDRPAGIIEMGPLDLVRTFVAERLAMLHDSDAKPISDIEDEAEMLIHAGYAERIAMGIPEHQD